jgi:hypothetical protein
MRVFGSVLLAGRQQVKSTARGGVPGVSFRKEAYMPQHTRSFRLLLLVSGSMSLLPLTAFGQSSASQIERIEISPAWAGSAGNTQALVTIANDHGVFRRTWNPHTITAEYNSVRIVATTGNGPSDVTPVETQKTEISQDTVDQRDVLDLVRALSASSLDAPILSNLGINHVWLEEHATDAANHFGNLGEPNDQRQQAFLKQSFTDLALIRKTIPRVVGSSWTDDPVWVHVNVRFVDGKMLQAETTNQPPFMLPWTCEADGKKARTYNADISRAVAKLLPDGSVNKERLQGAGLMDNIIFQMNGAIRQQWKEIGAEDKAKDALAHLREKYVIRRSEVSEHISLHFGPTRAEHGVENLQADVRLPDFPSNLVIATVFPLENGQAVGIDTFLHNGSQYEHLVLDNSWIMDSLRHHQDLGAWLVYVKDASMSEKAMKIFAADMHDLGRDDLAQEVSAHLFPDRHAILWRWDPNRDLFGWPASKVKTQGCTDYPTLNVGCSVAMVGPDGQLEK